MDWCEDSGYEGKLNSPKKKKRRLTLKTDSKLEVVLMADKCAMWFEHSLYNAGNPGGFFQITCLKCGRGSDGMPMRCPLCEETDLRRTKVAGFPVLVLAPFETQDGKTIDYWCSYMVASSRGWEIIKSEIHDMQEETGKSAVGARFTVKRTGDNKSPSTGDSWKYREHVDLSKYVDQKGAPVVPVDFKSIVQPSPEDVAFIMSVIKTGAAVSYVEEKSEDSADDDVPF